MRQRAMTPVLLAMAAVGVAGCGSSSGGESVQPNDVSGKVNGAMRPSILCCQQKQAFKKLDVSDVWCGWSGENVVMHGTFRNGTAAHVTVQVQPNYTLKNAGIHGDGLTSQASVGIDASTTRNWSESIGTPEGGIKPGTPINKCAPEINDVELG
jgi:hypothetical protein